MKSPCAPHPSAAPPPSSQFKSKLKFYPPSGKASYIFKCRVKTSLGTACHSPRKGKLFAEWKYFYFWLYNFRRRTLICLPHTKTAFRETSEGGCRYLLFLSEIPFGTYLPLFLRDLTHSVRRYSICPLTDLKSLSAHSESSPNNSALILSGICFFFPSFILIKTS